MGNIIDSFEDGFYPYDGAHELECPVHWEPDWVQGTEPGVNHRPEYKPKDKEAGQPEVKDGRYAASIHTRHASHDGVLWRQFNVGAGNAFYATVYVMGKGEKGGLGMVLGADTFGQINFTHESVLWSEWWSQDVPEWEEGKWVQLKVEGVAERDTITIYLRSTAREAADLNASHFDLFALEYEGGEPEPPEPPVGGGIWEYLDALEENAYQQVALVEGARAYLKQNKKACIVLGDE